MFTGQPVLISVRVQPNAGRSEVTGFSDGVLAVRVAAPPTQGKANRALIELLSRVLGIARSRISIVRGQSARRKVVAVVGLSQAELMARLTPG